MIEFSDNLIAVWMLPMPPERDFFCGLMREGDKFVVEGRLRTYNPASTNPHDGKDHKDWMRAELSERTVDEALRRVRAIMAQMGSMFRQTPEEVRAGSAQEWIRALQAKKWIHIQAYPMKGRAHDN